MCIFKVLKTSITIPNMILVFGMDIMLALYYVKILPKISKRPKVLFKCT